MLLRTEGAAVPVLCGGRSRLDFHLNRGSAAFFTKETVITDMDIFDPSYILCYR